MKYARVFGGTGKRLRKEMNQLSSAAGAGDSQTDESQEATNESSFNRLSDGGTSSKFNSTSTITQLSETKSEN